MSKPKPVAKFPCPKCGQWDSRVKDGRPDPDGYKRKRICTACGKTFITVEKAA
jgi:transcriptional regulator NrdR family protein